MAKATFGAGCFWGVEASFRQLPGVLDTAVGYEGGHLTQPTYRDVCTDMTGHAEVVEIDYNPEIIRYETLLEAFFSLHDPTQLNRQGPDYGTQYRSTIFYRTPDQKQAAEAMIAQLTEQKRFSAPIVTTVVPAQTFWKAEDYHQRYLEKRGLNSCHI